LNEPEPLPLVRYFGKRSAVTLGILVAVILGGLGSIALFFATDAAEAYRSGMQLWVTALLVGYVVGIVLLEVRRSGGELARLPGWDPPRHGAAPSNPFAVNRHPRALMAFTLGGIAFGLVFNVYVEGLVYQALVGMSLTWAYAWGPPLLMVLWGVVFHALWILIDNAFLLARIGEHEVRVDLNDVGALDVFANAGTRHMLLLVGGLAVFPIQSIFGGGRSPLDLLPGLLIVVPVGLFLFVWPVLAVRRAILRAKRDELAQIDLLLASAPHLEDRYVLLSLLRRQVVSIPAWPLSLRNLARLALYLVIPPLTWVAAAFVDAFVSRLV
jgi:hypothetical protein